MSYKNLQIHFYDFLEHLMICSTKFSVAESVSNGPKYQSISGTREEKKSTSSNVFRSQVFVIAYIVCAWPAWDDIWIHTICADLIQSRTWRWGDNPALQSHWPPPHQQNTIMKPPMMNSALESWITHATRERSRARARARGAHDFFLPFVG